MTRPILPLAIALALCLLPFLVRPAEAGGGWSDAQVSEALTLASNRHGVSRGLLRCIAFYETGGTFDPSVVGDNGESWGLYQLHRRGLRPTFYAWGYDDAFNPYEAADFTAAYIAEYGRAGARHWSPVKRGLC